MRDYRHIRVECEGRITSICINRPAVMNALDPVTHAEMAQAFDEFEAAPEAWVAILTGIGD